MNGLTDRQVAFLGGARGYETSIVGLSYQAQPCVREPVSVRLRVELARMRLRSYRIEQ